MRMPPARFMRPRVRSISAIIRKGRAARRKELTHEHRQRRLGAGEKRQRPAEIERGEADAGGEDAIDGTLAEAGGEAAQQTATDDMLDQIVGQGETTGDGEMADYHSREL